MESFEQHLESINHNSRIVIVPKGEVLYHGTIESFDTRKPRVGGYDEVFWTAEDPIIARSYIPSKSGYSCTTVASMIQDKEKLKKSLGIVDSIVVSVWKKENEGYKRIEKLDNQMKEYRAKWKEIEKNMSSYSDELVDEFLQRWMQIENDKKIAEKEWRTAESILSAYVIKKMQNLGYKVKNSYDCIRGVVEDSDGRILPNNTRSIGKVLKVICKRDFIMYNMAYGRDGDLMDLEYQKIDQFRKIEEKFDGVIINDFAQTDYHGNLGHKSIGFFKKSIKDLSIKQIRNQYHPSDEEWK